MQPDVKTPEPIMPRYEYKVVPAPARGEKAKGVKTPEGRFALSVQAVLNRMGEDGWEYLRAELLPSEERSGLTGSSTKWRNVLVFRRTVSDDLAAFEPELLAPPVVGPQERTHSRVEPPAPRVRPEETATDTPPEGVVDMTSALRDRAARRRTGPDEATGQDSAPESPDSTTDPDEPPKA